MAAIDAEALDGLDSTLRALIPDDPQPSLKPTMTVASVHVSPTGLGGFVGLNADPQGEIVGRHLDARVQVMVKAPDADSLGARVAATVHALLGADGATLRQQGILRMALGEMGAPGTEGSVVERELVFRVRYEFLKVPEGAAGTIQEIPIRLDVGRTDTTP